MSDTYFTERCPVCGGAFSKSAIEEHVALHDVEGKSDAQMIYDRSERMYEASNVEPVDARTAQSVQMVVRLTDLDQARLLIWELRLLIDDMRVGASPFSDRLEHALDRWLNVPVDDK